MGWPRLAPFFGITSRQLISSAEVESSHFPRSVAHQVGRDPLPKNHLGLGTCDADGRQG